MQTQRQRVVYYLTQPHRIGQLVHEIWYLRNMFDSDEYDFTIITPPIDEKVNKPVYDFVMRGVTTVQKQPSEFAWRYTEGIRTINGDIYVFKGPFDIEREILRKFKTKGPSFCYSLTSQDVERSKHLREIFGIPDNASIVTLHNREGGYLPELTYHSYRDANIENYIPTIEYLVSKGYYVIRLGDKSMKPLPPISDRVIDAPFHQLYSGYVDLYSIALSKFLISAPSGPGSLAIGLGVPMLWINVPLQSFGWSNKNDLIVPKKYYSKVLKRYLTYSEIVTSPILDFVRTKEYQQFNLELHENSSEEILRAVIEMEARLDGRYNTSDNTNALDQAAKKVQLKGHCFRQHACPEYPFYHLYWAKAKISHEFIKMNPWFLEEKNWIPDIEVIRTATDNLQKDKLLQKISNAEIKPIVPSEIS